MSRVNRRDFLKAAGAASVLAGTGESAISLQTDGQSATGLVSLGESGVRVTRLAFGTGTFGGRVQRELGQPLFTRLVRHAYDRGIRFFESADSYEGMHEMLAAALDGLPRESYKLMTKFRLREADKPRATIDRLRKELNSDYFDILLLHCVRTPGWVEELKQLRNEFSKAKQEGIILAQGASCHGLLPLRAFPGNDWLDVALVRINHDGTRMDNLRDNSKEKGDVSEVVHHLRRIHDQGTGIIGMKVMGEGRFNTAEERDTSLKYVMNLGLVDSVTIGYKSTAEIDGAIERINTHLRQ